MNETLTLFLEFEDSSYQYGLRISDKMPVGFTS